MPAIRNPQNRDPQIEKGQVLPFPTRNEREVIETAITTAVNTANPLVYEVMQKVIARVMTKTGLRRWPFGDVVAVLDKKEVRILARGA